MNLIDSVQPVRTRWRYASAPDWCPEAKVTLNNSGLKWAEGYSQGYLHIRPDWREGDTITLTLPMPVRRVYGNPLARHVAGKVAIQRGPLVYY